MHDEVAPNARARSRADRLAATGLGLLAIAVYGLALAPDVLYSDSGEFQTLAYTFGSSHPTGYPVYLLLARVAGFIPLNTPAWRISFFSAIAGGIAVGTLYLLVRRFTCGRGAMLASLALLLSYTFWAQSIIAEVYIPAVALICVILLLLLHWQEQPFKRRWLLSTAGLLAGLGLGIHMFLSLIAPAALMFVLWGWKWGTPEERGRWTYPMWLALGGVMGLAGFYLLFAFMDGRPTPTNFFATTMVPSRSAWNLAPGDFDTVLERFWMSVSALQWRDAMAPANMDWRHELEELLDVHLTREFTLATRVLAGLGMLVLVARHVRESVLIGMTLVVAAVAAMTYQAGDRHIFNLPVYLMLALLAGVGAGALLTVGARVPGGRHPAVRAALTALLVWLAIGPLVESRWEAVRTGESRFVTETYAYPVEDLGEPRRVAECATSKVAEDRAYMVLYWRPLYAIYYVAHVEQGRTGLAIREVRPHGAADITPTLLAEIAEQVDAGVPVYVDYEDPLLRERFTMSPAAGACHDYSLFRLARRLQS